MTSDFERKPNPYGTGGTASEITVGGDTQSGFGNNTSIREQGSGSGQASGGTSPASDGERARGVIDRETGAAKAELGDAARQVKEGAAHLASTARGKATEGVEAGKSQITSSLGDFAAAVRKASDELGERDQSMAAGLVREVANGLEQATGSIQGQSVQDLTRSVASFARRQPTTFLIGAALAGIALGRFARASGEHVTSSNSGRSQWDDEGERYRSYGEDRDEVGGMTPGRSAPSRPVSPPVSSGTTTPGGASTADMPVSYANPVRSTSGSGSGTSVSGGSLSTGATSSGSAFTSQVTADAPSGSASSTVSSGSRGTAPAEGPSDASLGHGSGSFNPQGGRDVR
jgi:hypothetical protein